MEVLESNGLRYRLYDHVLVPRSPMTTSGQVPPADYYKIREQAIRILRAPKYVAVFACLGYSMCFLPFGISPLAIDISTSCSSLTRYRSKRSHRPSVELNNGAECSHDRDTAPTHAA